MVRQGAMTWGRSAKLARAIARLRQRLISCWFKPRARRRTDLAARLKLRDGGRVMAAQVMAAILDDNKGVH